jgi:outer membrane protein assembly factor BamB
VPVSWTAQDGVLWKIPIPGIGNSSPIVWGTRVFLQSATEDGKERLLLCLNATDGSILWSQSVPGAPARMHARNTFASSTPATDGERVYAAFWDGNGVSLAAYSVQGKPVWQHQLGQFTSQHGPGTSPVVYEGKVFFADDQDGSATLYALDAVTGKVAWQAPRKAFRACYSTPFLLPRSADRPASELIVASTAGITGYDPASGKVNWNYTWSFKSMPLRTVASPILVQDMIVVNSGDGGGDRNTIAVRLGSQGDITRTNLVWQKGKGLPYVPSLLAYGDHIYFVNDGGRAGCLTARTGELVWSESLGGDMTASPVMIDGKIYAASERGTVYVFAAAPTFKLLAKNPVGELVMATPAVADNRLFIRGKTHLFCIGKPPDKSASRR